MYIKSPYPPPPPLPTTNAHYIFFKRPEQSAWADADFTAHVEPARGDVGRFCEGVEDLSTGLGVSEREGGLGLVGWEEGEGAEAVGGKRGKEIVGIMSENSSEYITLVHACLRIAVPFALISSYSTPFELKHALKLSKATRLFVDAKFLKTVLPAAREAGIPEDRIYLMKEGEEKTAKKGKGRKSFRSIIEDVRRRKTPVVDVRPAGKDTLAYLVFSSGTSGLPKAVMISHGNLIFSVGQAIVLQEAALAVYTPPNPESTPVTLAFLPLHHTYGLHSYCFRACLAPGTLIILPKWDIHVALRVIPQYKITGLTLIPSVVHQLVNHPGIEKADFSSVLHMNSGAAYLPPELHEKMTRLVPSEAQFGEGYGMSEATIAAITQPLTGMLGGTLQRIPGCTGILLPGMEAVLLKDESSCKLNEPGELWLRSANVALGYWNNPAASRATFVRGWLRTGDRFSVDGGGNFWFADRAKDTLKVSGAQVSPVEIENCLLAHPAQLITDATVAGVSGGRTDDEKVPRAWVVLSDTGKGLGLGSGQGENGDGEGWGEESVVRELDRWHRENLSKYKWLRGVLRLSMRYIPKSPTGKTLRRVLQDRYEAQLKKQKQQQRHGRQSRVNAKL
ncbi:hypothetical protein BDZ97DRAFT_1701982 [Flammula alnicola]|nr:hypothetical protein BDZ97DRAFT_1701982 [Flammula alnicola]